MASGGASSVLFSSSEREFPTNVPPAITADKQASPRPIATTTCVCGTVAASGSRELDAIDTLLPESVLAQTARLFQQHTRSIQIPVRRITQVAHQRWFARQPLARHEPHTTDPEGQPTFVDTQGAGHLE